MVLHLPSLPEVVSTITQLALINLGTEFGVCAEVDVIN